MSSSLQHHSTKVLNDQTNNNWLLQNNNNHHNWNIGYNQNDYYTEQQPGQQETETEEPDDEEQENNGNNNNKHLNYQTSLFTTQKLNNSSTKLSYTPYQLELLNSIYNDMKYPNSVQKTLIAKLIGITRDQVKVLIIYFIFLLLSTNQLSFFY